MISTAVIAMVLYWTMPLIGVELPLIYCLLFGALISPTDPIASWLRLLESQHLALLAFLIATVFAALSTDVQRVGVFAGHSPAEVAAAIKVVEANIAMAKRAASGVVRRRFGVFRSGI